MIKDKPETWNVTTKRHYCDNAIATYQRDRVDKEEKINLVQM